MRSIESIIIEKKLKLLIDKEDQSSVNMSEDSDTDKKISEHINKLIRYIEVMERNRENIAYKVLFSNKKTIGKFIIFIKKVIRKTIKWYVEPICFQQTDFNNAVTPSIGTLVEVVVQLNDKNQKLEYQIGIQQDQMRMQEHQDEEKKLKIDNLNEKIVEMSTVIEDLEMKMSNLLNQMNYVYTHQEIVEDKLSILETCGVEFNSTLKNNFWEKDTYSQSGEDAIIQYILMVTGVKITETTYLDLGANHAKDLSNTYALYKKGARGVLVEANKKLIPELKMFRNNDEIINKCVSTNTGEYIDFYVLNGDGLSTTSKESAEQFIQINPSLSIEEVVRIESISVNDIIEIYFNSKAPTILNVDIEGMDTEIIESMDFDKYRPLIIIVEMIEYSTYLVVDNKNQELGLIMNELGYVEYAFTGINSVFIDKNQLKEINL